jgi:hypothetical protein
MASPSLRDRVRFEQRALDKNQIPAGPFVELTTEPAELVGLRGGETVMAGRLEGHGPVSIVVRYHRTTALIDASCRAVDTRSVAQGGTGATFKISSAVPRPRRDFIDILATAQQTTPSG